MSKLLLIRGLPGSGKSTFAESISGYVVYSADDFFYNKFREYKFAPELLPQAHNECLRKTQQALKDGLCVAVANTFTRNWEMKPYLKFAKEKNIPVTVITCEGNYGNRHNVPEEKIKHMSERWEKYVPLE